MYTIKQMTTAALEKELRQSRRAEIDFVKTLAKWRMDGCSEFPEYRRLNEVLGILRQYIQRIESALETAPPIS